MGLRGAKSKGLQGNEYATGEAVADLGKEINALLHFGTDSEGVVGAAV